MVDLSVDDILAAQRSVSSLDAVRAPVAHSVELKRHISQGPESQIAFDPAETIKHHLSHPDLWLFNSTFIVPLAGLYSISLSFVRDSYGEVGTFNDVYVRMFAQSFSNKNQRVPIDVWAGQSPHKDRLGAAMTVVEHLDVLDALILKVRADDDAKRYLRKLTWTVCQIG